MSDNLPEQMHAPSTAVATRDATHDAEFDASDIRLPRLKFSQQTTGQQQSGLVPYGAIFVLMSQDDDEPTILAKAGKGVGDLSVPPVRFYVIGKRKGYSYSRADKSFQPLVPNYPDLSLVENGDPAKVSRTYDYMLVLPDFPDLPVMFAMSGKWGGQSAKALNTQLQLAEVKGVDPATVAFNLQAKKMPAPRPSTGVYAAAVIAVAKLTAAQKDKDLKLVEQFRDMAARPVASVDETPVQAAQPVNAPSLA